MFKSSVFRRIIEWIYLKLEGNLAYYDSLTGVKNRTYYDMVLRKRYCTIPCYVGYIDVDKLKMCNDTYGHNSGDELILSVVKQIKDYNPCEICRIGGDEFIIIDNKPISLTLNKASIGVYKKARYEDISSGVAKADDNCRRNKRIHREE